jgi:ankyrin repeat protein
MLQALLRTGTIDVNARTAHGLTVLHLAALFTDTEVGETLLSQPDIDVNARDSSGYPALLYALYARNTGFVERLIELPQTDLNLLALNGASPIYYAITKDLPGCVHALCRRADFDIRLGRRSEKGRAWTPLELAAYSRRVEIIQILLECPRMKLKKKEYGLKDAIQIAKKKGFSDCLQLLKGGRHKKEAPKEGFFAKLRTLSKASALSTTGGKSVSG